ncbi:uncharacterized protein ARMOST_13333 [Armillaria ostoyae]|uniref:Uncharacterized protein n=1 Tax=Armillaria ostoyae TaxID=47428 RepID=A0A284RMK0_ARMOS|nr:uncharacterized protein ARMOST_13333 [Armillaria ostoyae]
MYGRDHPTVADQRTCKLMARTGIFYFASSTVERTAKPHRLTILLCELNKSQLLSLRTRFSFLFRYGQVLTSTLQCCNYVCCNQRLADLIEQSKSNTCT